MKITGTKKFFIILFSLILAVAVFAGWGLIKTSAAAAETSACEDTLEESGEEATQPQIDETNASEDYYDECLLQAVAEKTDIDYDLVNFYAHSFEANAGLLHAAAEENTEEVKEGIEQFLSEYSSGSLKSNAEIDDEDWYVAPDEVSGYMLAQVNIPGSWTQFYTSKSFITTEPQYWGNSNFEMGPFYRWFNPSTSLGVGQRAYANADERYVYNWVWLEEGQSFEFGLYSVPNYRNITLGTMNAGTFFQNYLFDSRNRQTYWFNNTTQLPNGTDTIRKPDGSRRTLTDYIEDYRTSINPSTSFMRRTDGTGNNANSWKRVSLSADAPSGVYWMQFEYPYNNTAYRFQNYVNQNVTIPSGSESTWNSTHVDGYGWSNWSYYCRYAVVVHRAGITAPRVQYESGVNTDLTSRTTTYDGNYQTITLNGDWGPGLSTVTVNSTDISVVSRPTLGSGVHGNLVLRARNVGEYVITVTPFRNWSDGAGSTAGINYYFTIEKREMEDTYIVQEEGVDQATNTKFLYETGRDMYISLYPLPSAWMTYSAPGLSEYIWSDNGVLTLTGRAQDRYTILVSLRDPDNMVWASGGNEPKEFTFEIGPMKVTVPEIIMESGVDGLRKEVTYNGALQTMSFMPVDTTYLDVDCDGLEYTIRDNVLRVTAQDAGTFQITISVKSAFIFETGLGSSTPSAEPMVYTLIINEAEIDGPRLIDEDAVDGVKRVTYGGEKLANGQDWVATLTFEDCREERMSWTSNSLNQVGWGDTRLVLAGRYAGTYNVTFTPKKNYKWREGIDPNQQYQLIIERLRISEPTLVNDGPQTHPDGDVETGYEYSSTRKAVDFDGLEHSHSITLFFGTSTAASAITYAKSGSIDPTYNAQLIRRWSDDGDYFTLTGSAAGSFEIMITPSPNYCWDDATGSTTGRTFIFHIKATGTPSLAFASYFAPAQEWRPVDNYDLHESQTVGSYYVEEDFTGEAYRVRIGGGLGLGGLPDYTISYMDPQYHFFDVINEFDDIITDVLREKEWWSETSEGGYLTLSFVDAGIYRIRVSLRDTNFCWMESEQVTVIYTIKINAQGITDARIDRLNSSADVDELGQGGRFDWRDGDDFTMYAIYFNTRFTLAVSLPYTVREYVNITTPEGDVYGRGSANGYYPYWSDIDNLILFSAIEKGDYAWKITISDQNYAWRDNEDDEYEFKIHISRSGVSGLEMHFLGEDADTPIIDAETLRTDKDILGGGVNNTSASTVFSESYQYIYVKRTNTQDLVYTGFSTQFSYEVAFNPLETGYEDDLFMTEAVYDDDGLKLYALNAGTYSITITPKENYTWKNADGDNDNIASLTFTFVINKLSIVKPTIIADEGDGADAINNATSTKTISYNRQRQPLTLGLIGDADSLADGFKYTPFAYKITSFEYINGENADVAGDYLGYVNGDIARDDIVTTDIRYDGVEENSSYSNNADGINLAAQLAANGKDFDSYSVWAQSSGEYRLVIRIDNINNYQWSSDMLGEECVYYLVINQLGVDLPEAYLLNVDIDPDDPDSGFEPTSEYLSGNGVALNGANFYQASFEYDSLDHLLYIVGSSISSGDFTFSFDGLTTNVGSAAETQPTEDNAYYTLCAATVNTYTVTIRFVTRDYYWNDAQAQGSISREFKLVISTKLIEVPKIEGEELQILRNNSYTKNFNYLQRPESITITGINFGTDSLTGNTASDTAGRYSLINARISGRDNSGTTAFDVVYEDGVLTDRINMFTSRNDGDAAQVTYTYCLELYLDPANTRWNSNGAGDTANKLYYIVIEKASVTVPFINETKTTTGEYLYRTYTGEEWIDELKLECINSDYMEYTLSDALMSAEYDSEEQRLSVSTPAPVNSYIVTVNLRYPSNMEWKDMGGSVAPLQFYLVIQPIRVAKPYIYFATTEGEEGVQGWKKTVTYNYAEQSIQIGNFWKDDDNRWMTATVANGTFTNQSYIENHTPVGEITGEMEYNSYNNGLLVYGAVNAGTYIVRFSLSGNAVWADGTSDDIDVTFLIEKLQYTTPYIEADNTGAVISGTVKTYTYELDNGGNAIVRGMKILEYDESIMEYFGVAGGTASSAEGDGYIYVANPEDGTYDGTYYMFEAANADSYIVTFKIKNFENTRWAYADNETISFTLRINRLTLDNPVLNNDYQLRNETIEATGLEVDYDTREHTLLLENIVGDFGEAVGGVYGSYYVNFADTTRTDNPDNPYGLTLARYADTEELTVGDIYGSTYDGVRVNEVVQKRDIITATAAIPGVYYLTVSLADDANMVWADGTNAPKQFTLTINRMEHDAPRVATSTSSSQEYSGGDVLFRIQNIYNGKLVQDGPVVSTQYERYELVSYDGNADIDVDAINANSVFEESWYNGLLTLKMSAIGTYTFKVSIIDPTYTGWKNTASTEATFTFTITKRNITGEFSFSSTDEETNASLSTGATEWAISSPVTATLRLSGLRDVNGAVDDVLGLKLYFVKSTEPDDELSVLELPKVGENWRVDRVDDGTYTLTYIYDDIPHGRGNILKGSYMLYAVQTDTDGNYALADVRQRFGIVADPAPFKTNLLTWNYSWNTDGDNGVYSSGAAGREPDSRLHLPYLTDGGIYQFEVGMNEEGMLGFDNAGYTDLVLALNSWQVTWDGNYGGTQRISNAGDYTVSVTITAFDPDFYSFNDYVFTLYITIDKALYDLSGLAWDYDGSQPFTFDGTNKSVNIVGDFPDGLTVASYRTTYSFTSGSTTVNNQTLNGNTIPYSGEYVTTVVFGTAPNSNYQTPVNGNNSTYTGTFEWSRSWTVNKRLIQVRWASNTLTNSDGDTITYTLPQIDGSDANKFNYTYRRQDANGVWQTVTRIERVVGQEVDYQVLASLKSDPRASAAATDYARNYEFEFPYEENPMVYTLGADDTVVFNHIEVNGSIDSEFEYTGSPFTAEAIIDLDTSGGEITASNIIVVYYAASNTSRPISAPTNPGDYVVKLKLRYSNTMFDYTLSESEFEFTINKATFKDEEFEWHLTHETDEGSYEAVYNARQGGRWINIETGEQVTPVYDGYAYNISLVSTYSQLTIRMLDASVIDAGDYTSTARFTYNTDFYVEPTIRNTFNWTVERALLDLSLIQWSYEAPFEFGVVNGNVRRYSVEMLNLPDFLVDKVTYITTYGATFIEGGAANAGNYTTTCSINDISSNTNYILGEWPAEVPNSINWTIARKQIPLPESDGSWMEFDGNTHNLSNVFGFDVDWAEYFSVNVNYTDSDGTSTTAYDGTHEYGNRFLAYNAGTYTLELKINPDLNSYVSNVVWAVNNGVTTVITQDDQTATLNVEKTTMHVTGWYKNYESSYVLLSGGVSASKFIDYEYYTGDNGTAGTKVSLDSILESMGGDLYSIVPVVKEAYRGNINLTFEPGNEFTYFTTLEIDESDFVRVSGKPYIYGYTPEGGAFIRFGNDAIANGEIYAEYTGSPITFSIFNWDSYLSNYVEIWGGDELTQTEAGTYSVTFILRKDGASPYYWGPKEDGTGIDRSSVTVNFEIRYKMLTIPQLPEKVTYSGARMNILTFVENATYTSLLAEYGDYVEITGGIESNIGTYVLYLAIKDEYGTAIRWNDGTVNGYIGTYTFVWTIDPVLLRLPFKNEDAHIVYDGTEHTVFEALVGYDPEGSSEELIKLMESVRVTAQGFRSVNAGTFTATFSLPNSNFAWVDENGNIDSSISTKDIEWTIEKFVIDLSETNWNYNEYFEENGHGFEYTLENGRVYQHRVYLTNLPEVLEYYVSYSTNGEVGNSAGDIGSYTTRVSIDTGSLDTNNYVVGALPGNMFELTWEIVGRTFALPENSGEWTTYDGGIHDLMVALGFEEGWDSYFDVAVEYRESVNDEFQPYGGDEDEKVGFSLYNGYYYGFYRLTITIKEGINTADTTYVSWFDGTLDTKIATLEVSKLTIEITGWEEDDEYSRVTFGEGVEISEDILDLLEYVIYDPVAPDVIISPDEVTGGVTYNIEYRIKPGNEYGIEIVTAPGISNPLEFGNYNYGSQVIVWLPAPVLETSSQVFTNEDIEFVIKGWDSNYNLSDAQKMAYRTYHNIIIPDEVKKYVYLNDETSLTGKEAGTYTAVVRLLSQLNLSWYDSSKYFVNSSNQLVEINGGRVIAAEEEAQYYNRKSYILNYEITKKPVQAFNPDDFEDFAEQLSNLVLSYNAEEQDITKDERYADLFNAFKEKYGALIEFEGNKGTDAKEYELFITLADKNSSFWTTGETEESTYSVYTLDGYELRYIQVENDGETEWKLVLIKVNEDGSLFVDSSGNNVLYNGGDYTLDVAYEPVYSISYVPVVNDEGDSLINEDGTPVQEPLYDANDNFIYIDGERVYKQYVVDETGIAVLYKQENGEYVPVEPGEDTDGTTLYLARYEQDENGYKVTVKEYVYEYAYLFDGLTDGDGGIKIPALKADGTAITDYLFGSGTSYELRRYRLDENASFVVDDGGNYSFTVLESNCEIVTEDGVTEKYSFVNGEYVADASGNYLMKYAVDENGDRLTKNVAAVDENGNPIVDASNSKVTVSLLKQFYDSYKVGVWNISNATVASPYVDPDKVLSYNGKEQSVKDVLRGFNESMMEISGVSSATDAGEYTARIALTAANSVWADETGEYITITWKIEKATVDLSDVVWDYSQPFEYTRVNGKAVVRRVKLLNLPEALSDKVRYTTNGTVGSNAGRDAGKYITTFEFVNLGDNFNEIVIPETVQTSCTWNITRKLLTIPHISNNVWVVFDNEPHDILQMLGVERDWEEYFEITVQYFDGTDYVDYPGYDNNKYLAYGAGLYRFYFNIKAGINVMASNPNVVWFRGYNTEPDEPDTPDDAQTTTPDNSTEVTPEGQLSMFIILPTTYNLAPPDSGRLSVEQVMDIYNTIDEEEYFVLPDGEDFGLEEGWDIYEIAEELYYFAAPDSALYAEGDEGISGDEETPDEQIPGEDNPEEAPDEGEDDDDVIIADPIDPDPDDYDWTTIRQEITMEVGKFRIMVEGWYERDASSTIMPNFNPYGEYNEDLVNRIISLGVIRHTLRDINGNEVELSDIQTGHTYFIHAEIIDRYADYIELVYDEGVPRSYDYSDFGNEILERVPEISQTRFELAYTGSDINFSTQILNDILRDRNYLTLVESESDGLIQSRAGTYYATICFTDGARFCWDSGRNNDRSAVRIEIVITSKRIEAVTSLNSVEFTGLDIDMSEVLAQIPEFGEYVTVANGYTAVARDVGVHTFNVVIKDEYLDSIVWLDGTNGPITITWEITPATLTGTWNELGVIDFSTENTSFEGNYDDVIEYVYTNVLTGAVATSLVRGETYRVEARLTDENNVILGNILNPVTGLHENPYEFTLNVDITVLARPVMTQTELEYTGYARTFGIRIDGVDISEYSDYLEIVEDESDSLTQTVVKPGGYSVKIRLKNGARWVGNGNGDVTLRFDITPAQLSGNWNRDSGTLTFPQTYPGNFISYEYRDMEGNVVTRAQMVKGERYRVEATLLDEVNFAWNPAPPSAFEFTLNVDMLILEVPRLTGGSEYPYTGRSVELDIENWDYYSQYVDIVDGGLYLSAENAVAGSYNIILKVKDGVIATWADGSADTYTIAFTITPAVLSGEWRNDGKVSFTSTYQGNYDDVVEYVYINSNGEEVRYADLVDGESYTVTVRVRQSQANNFVLADELTQEHEFTFDSSANGGSSFPWWIFLIIGAVVLLIIIIIIIIIVRRRRSDDDDYDDYYNDEDYYNEDEDFDDYGDDGYSDADY